ncbi:MAG: Rho termination factor N-terminal domain-containing protein, partial [Holosporaceae bacterium]
MMASSVERNTLKSKSFADLLAMAEDLGIDNASSLRRQDLMFAILKAMALKGTRIQGGGVLSVLQDGFGFLRSAEANFLPGPDDIYVSTQQVRRLGLRTGDTLEGELAPPREGERYFSFKQVE